MPSESCLKKFGEQLPTELRQRFGNQIQAIHRDAFDPWIEVAAAGLVDVCRTLRDESPWQLDMLNCITGIDYFTSDPKQAAKVDWQPHLQVVYHLSSIQQKHSLVLKVRLPRWKDDREGELPELPTVSGIWSTAELARARGVRSDGSAVPGSPGPVPHSVPGGLGGASVAQGLRNAAGIPRDSRA